jgi:hypothetical protein
MEKAKSKLASVKKGPAAKKAKAIREKTQEETGNDPGAVSVKNVNDAAKTALTKSGGRIAILLLREAMFGGTPSTKMLVGLADDPPEEEKPEGTEDFLSQALRLANEPPWEDKNLKAAAETGQTIDAREG